MKDIFITEQFVIIALYILWNIVVFFMYGLDKSKAKRGKWRISENALILSAFLMGGIGAFLAMTAFRHKTKHLKFKLGVPIAVLINILAIYMFVAA